MKIHKLELENFRGFEKLTLELDPSLTLLIGENGAGKTAVLEGLSVALGGALFSLSLGETRGINSGDVRVRIFEHEGMLDRQMQWPVRIIAAGTVESEDVTWGRIWRSLEALLESPVASMAAHMHQIADAVRAGEPRALPVIAYYGTQRLWPTEGVSEVKRGVGSRFDGYIDALNPASSPRLLAAWMFQQTLVELQRRKEVPQLRAVERAVCQCIQGATRFYYDVKEQDLILEREGAEALSFSNLSDGTRNMVALVADIAWRASVLNPQFGRDAAARSEGVILIDEIDLHLHPRWQRRVLGDLRRTFPGLQFVTTTHSPQVIASVRRNELRVLANNALVEARPFVEGRDSNSLLEDVLGVPERPDDVRAKIDEMFRVLDDERYEQGRALLDGLEAQLGPDDPAVIRAHWILDHEAAPKEPG